MTVESVVQFDSDLHVEAYRFNGIMQNSTNHFHEYIVIGFIEQGQRKLSCKNNDYIIDHKTLVYRCLNFIPNIMKKITEDMTGVPYLPLFKNPVTKNSDILCFYINFILSDLLFMLPALVLVDFKLGLHRFENTTLLLNMLFLGIGVSALCFVTWNFAEKKHNSDFVHSPLCFFSLFEL